MSVTFHVCGETPEFETADDSWLNISNVHAIELLRWLGYEVDPSELDGVLAPGDLRARCRRRLASTPENVASDLPRAGLDRVGRHGCRVIMPARDAGYLRSKAAVLLRIAERAGDRLIVYG